MTKQPPFHRPNRIEVAYRRAINALIDRYFQLPSTLTLGEITQKLVEFGQLKTFFHAAPWTLASKMITMTMVNNAANWREAAKIASKGQLIHHLLTSELSDPEVSKRLDTLVWENVKLIGSLPEKIAASISKDIQTEFVAGERAETISKKLRARFKNVKDYEVARLVRTEVSKADTSITRVRAEKMGLNWYQWLTSEDARVRPGHRLMDKVLINWSDPPAPELLANEKSQGHYNAGNIYNCRCIPVPILSLDEVSWPAKVYMKGQVKHLTRTQFQLVSGVTRRLVA